MFRYFDIVRASQGLQDLVVTASSSTERNSISSESMQLSGRSVRFRICLERPVARAEVCPHEYHLCISIDHLVLPPPEAQILME